MVLMLRLGFAQRGATESAEKFIVLFVFKGLSSSVECGWSFASCHVPPSSADAPPKPRAGLCHKEAPVELCATDPEASWMWQCGIEFRPDPVFPELFFGHELIKHIRRCCDFSGTDFRP